VYVQYSCEEFSKDDEMMDELELVELVRLVLLESLASSERNDTSVPCVEDTRVDDDQDPDDVDACLDNDVKVEPSTDDEDDDEDDDDDDNSSDCASSKVTVGGSFSTGALESTSSCSSATGW
jgi:hypothetical protein